MVGLFEQWDRTTTKNPEKRISKKVINWFAFDFTFPLQDLNVLLLEPLLCCLGRVFWVIVMLEYSSTTHFQCPGWLQCPGPDGTCPFDAVQLSCPLSRITPPKHNVLVSSDHNTFTQFSSESFRCSLANFRRACTCAFLSSGTLRALQDFSPSWRSVTNCFLGDYGSSCLEIIDKILPCSSGLISHRSHDHWNSTSWDLASADPRLLGALRKTAFVRVSRRLESCSRKALEKQYLFRGSVRFQLVFFFFLSRAFVKRLYDIHVIWLIFT